MLAAILQAEFRLPDFRKFKKCRTFGSMAVFSVPPISGVSTGTTRVVEFVNEDQNWNKTGKTKKDAMISVSSAEIHAQESQRLEDLHGKLMTQLNTAQLDLHMSKHVLKEFKELYTFLCRRLEQEMKALEKLAAEIYASIESFQTIKSSLEVSWTQLKEYIQRIEVEMEHQLETLIKQHEGSAYVKPVEKPVPDSGQEPSKKPVGKQSNMAKMKGTYAGDGRAKPRSGWGSVMKHISTDFMFILLIVSRAGLVLSVTPVQQNQVATVGDNHTVCLQLSAENDYSVHVDDDTVGSCNTFGESGSGTVDPEYKKIYNVNLSGLKCCVTLYNVSCGDYNISASATGETYYIYSTLAVEGCSHDSNDTGTSSVLLIVSILVAIVVAVVLFIIVWKCKGKCRNESADQSSSERVQEQTEPLTNDQHSMRDEVSTC